MSLRSHFPVFSHHPDMVYLDSASTAQKPSLVIEGMKHHMEQEYANIHRGAYDLSEASEVLYHGSKEAVVRLINARETAEISYSYNATSALNILVTSLVHSGQLGKGDKVLLSRAEHHANIVPWLIAKETAGIEVEFIGLDADFGLDFADFEAKLTRDVRVVSLTAASNVTGTVFDLAKVRDIIRSKNPAILFVVDASQAVPHFKVDVQTLDIDYLVFTGHKCMSDTGIGIMYGKKSLLKTLVPSIGGGGAINWVHEDSFAPAGLPSRFEPGTPHIIGAGSLLRAIEFMESIGGYTEIERIEKELVQCTLARWQIFKKQFPEVRLIGSEKEEGRIGVFSFATELMHISDISDAFADRLICVRAGHHCAEPLMQSHGITGSVRMSLFLYNTREDVNKFFDAFEEILSSAK